MLTRNMGYCKIFNYDKKQIIDMHNKITSTRDTIPDKDKILDGYFPKMNVYKNKCGRYL